MFKQLTEKLKNWLSKLLVQQEDVVGVDIMPGYIRIAEVEQNRNSWTLNRVGYRYVEGQVDTGDLENDSDGYADKLTQVLQSNKVTTTSAAVSIPVSSAIIRVLTLPLMTDDELQEAVSTDSLWENVVQLPDALDEYSVFHQVITRSPKDNSMDILFVASKLSDIELYMSIVRRAGLNPVVVDVRCFSLRNALDLRKNIDSKRPIALLEFGPFENYLLVLLNDSPFIAEIYVSEQDKEKFLTLSASSISDDEAAQMFERFALQVSQVISTYQSKYNTEIKRIFLTSTLPSISDPVDLLQQRLTNIQVDSFDPVADVLVPEHLEKKMTAEPNLSMFAPVLGLATRKLDIFGYYQYQVGVNNINLLPNRDQVKAKEKAKKMAKIGLVFGILLVVMFAAWSFLGIYEDTKAVDSQMEEYYAVETDRQEKQFQLDEILREIDKLAGLLAVSSDVFSNQKFMYALLTHINSSVVEGISLKSISYAGGVVTIVGESLNDHNIIEFNSRLDASPLIDRASLQTMSVRQKEGVTFKTFALLCDLGDERQELDASLE